MIDSLDQIFVRVKQLLLAPLAGAPDWVVQIASSLINIFALLGVFLTLFALISVLERKILGRMQNRYGPNRVGPFGLFQPVADGIKMLIKEDIVPVRADKIVHFLAPILIAATAILSLGVIPYGRNMTPFAIDGGILFFFAVGSTTELAVFMAGWGSNNKYSMLGAMRAIAQMISYELPLIITVLPVVMMSALLFVYIWLRGTLPRTRVDQIMNFAWKFMLPMAFTCFVAAAVWHYTGRGLRGWLWSFAVVAAVYFTLSILLDTRRRFSPRTYRFAESTPSLLFPSQFSP